MPCDKRVEEQLGTDSTLLGHGSAGFDLSYSANRCPKARQRCGFAKLLAALLLVFILGICVDFANLPKAQASGPSTTDSSNSDTARGGEDSFSTPVPTSNSIKDRLTAEERTWLSDHPVIRVVQDPNWPPVEFMDERGEYTGIAGDYLKLIEQRLGVTFERVRGLTWQESYDRLKRWEIDMTTCVTVTPERARFWAFTRPYMKIPIVILAQDDVTYISSMHELEGKTVAVVDGYAAGEWIRKDFPDIRLVKVNNVKEGLDLLQQDRVFAFIDNMLVAGYYLSKLKMSNIKIAGETPYANNQSMAVRKDWEIFAGILQKAIDSIPEDERNQIYQKWVPIRYEHGFNYSLLWQVVAAFMAVLLVLAAWIRRLFREIRSRKEAEAALSESKIRMKNILDNVGACVFMKDIQYRYSFVNNKICDLFGRREEDILGKSDDAFFTAKSAAEIRRNDRLVFESGETVDYERDLAFQGKPPRTYWTTKIPLRDNNGRILGLCGISTDVTDRKAAEEERKALQEQLHQAQKMESVGRLAGGVAHDFNNMLGIILGYTDMALAQLNPGQPLYADLREVRKAANRSADLTRQLLAFARKQTVAPRVLDLNRTVEGMLNMLRRLIGEDIDLLWLPGAGVCQVNVDPSQIDQILANLCVNARDAIAGAGKLTIETRNVVCDDMYTASDAEYVPGKYVLLAVSDNGCGMDKGTVGRLFEPFFTTKETGKGTGLGLSTVYGIVKQNNGFVNVYSEPGRGTAFNIYLPACEGETEQTPRKDSAEPVNRGNETILLVEDEPSILDMTARMLESLGYTVLTSSTPMDAIRLAKAHPGEIHLLMTDVVMPVMNGRELAAGILAFCPKVKRLFTSGYTADVIAHHGVLDPDVHFIQKPFTKQELATRVREAIDN